MRFNARKLILVCTAAPLLALGTAGIASAQEVTLRLHQFLPPVANIPKKILRPWAEGVTAASEGRIKIEHFDSMSLGGRPPELFDQASDGVVDIVMTLTGYSPGRFPRSEVFELPFIMQNSVATSKAFWEMMESDLHSSEFQDVKILAAWVHGPGLIHSRDGITSLEDMKGTKLRGPTRIINDLLKELGATPVGMPLPAIPESLTKGVIDASVVPWEVTPSIKLAELVTHHTEFSGAESLYTATFILAMNKAKYDSMPEDLQVVLNAESGMNLTELAATVMLAEDAPARALAEGMGNTIVVLDEAETARWKDASLPVYARWIESVGKRDIDGEALIEQARALIQKHQ